MRTKSANELEMQRCKLYHKAIERDMRIKGFNPKSGYHAQDGWFAYMATNRDEFISKVESIKNVVNEYIDNIYKLHGVENSGGISPRLANLIWFAHIPVNEYVNYNNSKI